jgi:hypothetical protein
MDHQKIDICGHFTNSQKYIVFIPLLFFQIWLAHALCFFSHEFSHSITAWLLGWKENPLALNYGHLSVAILLAQFGIDENVNYQPIFSTGLGRQAGIIAAAGMVIGNMFITYTLSRWFYRLAKRRNSQTWGMFFYLTAVASLGNLWDYIPIRTFATGGDIHIMTQGFDCSPWLILLVLGVPTMFGLIYFFRKIQPDTLLWLFPNSKTKRGIMIVLTSFGLFSFYGAAGWVDEYGLESKWLSIFSIFVVFPVMTLYGFWHIKKTSQ